MTLTIDKPLTLMGRRGWTVREFESLLESGVLGETEKLELIEGEIVSKMGQNEPRMTAVLLMQYLLLRIFAAGYVVRVQLPLNLGAQSRPEPDFAVVRGDTRDGVVAHSSSVVLVVEISDATLIQDREAKAAIYARANVPEYWIVNLPERTLEVRRQPAPLSGHVLGHGYRNTQILDSSDSFSPLQLPEASICVADMLP